MKHLFTILCIVLCTLKCFGQDLSAADQAMQSQDYLSAFSIYSSCYEADTNNVNCLYLSGISAYRSGDNKMAKKYLLKLENKDTMLAKAWVSLAAIYEEEENPPKAIKYYTRLQESNPNISTYSRKLGRLYRLADSKTDAWRYYAKAYKTNPRDIKCIKGLAELAMANSQGDLADSIIIEGLKIDSTHIGLNLLRAKLKYKVKAYQETAIILESVLGSHDFNAYYHKLYGYALVQIDSSDKAIFHLSKALAITPEDEKVHYYLGTAYEKLEDEKSAIFHFEKAADYAVSSSIDKYFRNLAKLYDQEKDFPKAIEAYKEAYRYGEDPKMLYYLARASDIYYKDKSIAITYYGRYINSKDDVKSYKNYATERKRYLQEQMHQSK